MIPNANVPIFLNKLHCRDLQQRKLLIFRLAQLVTMCLISVYFRVEWGQHSVTHIVWELLKWRNHRYFFYYCTTGSDFIGWMFLEVIKFPDADDLFPSFCWQCLHFMFLTIEFHRNGITQMVHQFDVKESTFPGGIIFLRGDFSPSHRYQHKMYF